MATTITAEKLGNAFGLDARRIQQLAKLGVVKKIGHGGYDAWASAVGLVRYYADIAKRKEMASDDPLHKARTRLTEAKAETAEIDAALARGEVFSADIVEALMTDGITKMKAKTLSIPTRLAPQLADVSDIKLIHQLLTDALHEALAEVADYDPEPLVTAFNEKRGRAVPADLEDGEPAAEADGQRVG